MRRELNVVVSGRSASGKTTASRRLSTAADNFEVARRVVFCNGRRANNPPLLPLL